jgi:hypothetical protein
MSGIIFLQQSEGGWTGRMLNEFGLGMFDFSVRRGKCKLSNMMPMIDKWYIRRTVAGDLGYLLGEGNDGRMSKGHAIERRHGGGFIMTNTRRRITYTFHPIRQ